jgi:hypothetical protein
MATAYELRKGANKWWTFVAYATDGDDPDQYAFEVEDGREYRTRKLAKEAAEAFDAEAAFQEEQDEADFEPYGEREDQISRDSAMFRN